MSESARVQRWRQRQREAGKEPLTIWLTTTEKLHLEDMALRRHCSPSELVQQALALLRGESLPVTATVTDDLKAYASLIARIPQDLVDQVKRYASEHRSTISELIRDGLEMRLDTDLPWHAPGRSPDTAQEVLPEVLHAIGALTPMLRTLVEETVRATLTEVLPEVLHREISRQEAIPEVLHEVLPDRKQVLPGHTSTLQDASAAPGGGMTEVIQGHTEVIPSRATTRSTRRGKTEVIPAPASEVQTRSQGMTEVVPLSAPKPRGRQPVLRPGILALLEEHQAGLTAAELKVHLGTAKPIGDTLAGMVKAQLLVKVGSGQAVRYQRAGAAPAL